MQLKLFVVPIKNLGGAEAEMNGFLRGHRVLAVKKEFVADGENSFWTFCVEYLDGTAAATGGGPPGPRAKRRGASNRITPWRETICNTLAR
jgi:hypothetical protein